MTPKLEEQNTLDHHIIIHINSAVFLMIVASKALKICVHYIRTKNDVLN